MSTVLVRSRMRRAVLLLSTLVCVPSVANSQGLLDHIPVTSGASGGIGGSIPGVVHAFAKAGNTVFIGGKFDYVGPATGSTALLDAAATPLSFPRVSGSTYALAPDGTGGWYIGGGFANVAGYTRFNVAHIRADMTTDPAWAPTYSGFGARSIAVSGTTVFVGGTNGVIALDASTGASVPGFTNPAAGSEIDALIVNGSTLYMGGRFSSIGGQPRQNLAAVDAATGAVLPFTANANNAVFCLALDGTTLYAGGQFTGLTGFVRNHAGAVDAGTGALLAWNPNADQIVQALAVQAGTVYLGGFFTTVGGQARNRLAAISIATGSPTSWNPSADGTVYALAVQGGTVYAGGNFSNAGGQLRLRIAAIDASTAAATTWSPGASDIVHALQIAGSNVLAGGRFCSAGGKARSRLAAFDASTGAVTSWNPGADDLVNAIATDGVTVYVGGKFTTAGGQPRTRLAALSATTGAATSWNPDADGTVNALAIGGSVVYAGGEFAAISGKSRPFIAAINTSNGVATTWNPNANDIVNDIQLQGGSVLIGGDFTNVGGQPRSNLAALNPATATATAWDPSTNGGGVYTINTAGTSVYAAGGFTALGGALRRYAGAVDVNTGIATAFNPNPEFPPPGEIVEYGGRAYSTVVYSSAVFIGGAFRLGLAELQLPNGTATTWNPPFVFAWSARLFLDGSILYEGGELLYQDPWGPHRHNLIAFDLALPPVAVPGGLSTPRPAITLAPNPTTGPTRVGFALSRDSRVRVRILDLQGREIARPADGWLPAGSHDVRWDGGQRRSGVYFVRVEVDNRVLVGRLVLTR